MALAEKSVLPQLSSGPGSLTRSIEDLTSYQYEADVSTQLEQVVTYLKNNPDVPGVILRQDGKFTGALSRWKIFEWLGRPYGIELYFRKPIKKLADAIMPGRELYPSTTSIDDAVQQALHRSPERRYDPLVVLFEDGSLRLLDMYVLLLAQSEQLANVNAMIQKQAEIGKVLSSSLELSDVLSLILEQMESVIPYQRASILLLHEDGLHFAASRGYTEQINMDAARELANKNPIFSKVMTLRQPIAIEDVSAYTDWPHIPNTTRTHSWLGLPLVQKDTILGMLSISRLQVSPFRADEIEAASIFSSQASTALYNARLYEKLQQVNQELSKQRKNLQEAVDELNHANVRLMRHSRQLETSYQIGQQVTSLLSLKELLPRIVNILRTQFNYSLVSIWMFNETAKSLVLEACTDPSLLGTTIPLNHAGLVAQAFRTGKILLENSIVRQTAFTPTPGLRTAFSEVDIPLKFHTDILGILDIQSERMQAFSEDDLAILQITATQIVVAVRNAMSYDKIARLSQNISQN